jgi:hypothetical protein
VVSFSTTTTLTGVAPNDLDAPAQTALVSMIAALLSLETTAIHINEMLDQSTSRRSLSANRIELLSTEPATEIRLSSQAVTEAQGYSDPNEMIASFQDQLSVITTDDFVSDYLSECEDQGGCDSLLAAVAQFCGRELHDHWEHHPAVWSSNSWECYDCCRRHKLPDCFTLTSINLTGNQIPCFLEHQ